MNLLRKQSFACASCDVLPGAGVTSHADHRNRPQRVICLAISATIEPVAMDLARGCLQRTGTAKRRQCRLAVLLGGVASDHQQSSGRLRTDNETSKKSLVQLSWSDGPVGHRVRVAHHSGQSIALPASVELFAGWPVTLRRCLDGTLYMRPRTLRDRPCRQASRIACGALTSNARI